MNKPINMNTEINYCPCCGTNLRAVSIALGFAANPTPPAREPAPPRPPRSRPQPANARTRTLVTEQLEEQILALVDKGTMTRTAVANELGCSKSTVVRTLQKLRPELIKQPTRVAGTKAAPRVSDEERAKVMALSKAGKKPTAIATELRMPVKRVHGIVYDKAKK